MSDGERILRQPTQEDIKRASDDCQYGPWNRRFSVGELATRLEKDGISPVGVQVVLDGQCVEDFNWYQKASRVSDAYYPKGTYTVDGHPTRKRFIPDRGEIDTLRVALPQRGDKEMRKPRIKTVRSDPMLFRLPEDNE